MEKPAFQLFDEVYFDGELWHISGISLKVGYDFCAYEYQITRGYYSAIPYGAWGNRVDVIQKCNMREEQLLRPKEFLEKEKQDLLLQLEKLKEKEAALKKELGNYD